MGLYRFKKGHRTGQQNDSTLHGKYHNVTQTIIKKFINHDWWLIWPKATGKHYVKPLNRWLHFALENSLENGESAQVHVVLLRLLKSQSLITLQGLPYYTREPQILRNKPLDQGVIEISECHPLHDLLKKQYKPKSRNVRHIELTDVQGNGIHYLDVRVNFSLTKRHIIISMWLV